MAIGGVFMTDEDGNIGREISNLTEKVCGLLFDTASQTDLWTKGVGATLASKLQDTVIELNSLKDAEDLGITKYTGEIDENSESKDFFSGIPYYHIKHFFEISGGSGRLFLMFADCSNNWDALIDMQKAAVGAINQFGVWTEQNLWVKNDEAATQYSIQLVNSLNSVAVQMANDYNAPACILLCANSAKVGGTKGGDKITISEIPTCKTNARYVAVLLGQGLDEEVSDMQRSLSTKTPVGTVGAALGCLTLANVCESIGHVRVFDLVNYFPDIEFGFGDTTEEDGKLKNTTKFSSLTTTQLDDLDDKGYVFLLKYTGLEGHVYFSGDQTCSDGDYRTIARNRTINKSRRSVRTALLPFVNSPIKVNASTGQLSAAQITVFKNLIADILNKMETDEEIGGTGTIDIPASQNILKNDTLTIRYTIIPMGTAKAIEVTEGLVLKQ